MVSYIINNEWQKRGYLKDETPIVGATSANTGIVLYALGSYYK